MLDCRQRSGLSTTTSDIPGTITSHCAATWPRWGWPRTPTRQCPSVRERGGHGGGHGGEASGEALCAKWPGGRSQPPRKGNALSGPHRLCRLATWWRTMGRTYKAILPGMRIIIIETHRDRFGIRSASLGIFIQLSDKPSLILCRRIRWRLNDWFMSALRLRPPPGPQQLEPEFKARKGVWL